MPATRDLTIYQGDAYDHELTFTDDAATPAPINLSSGSWRAHIRKHAQADTLLAAFTIDDTDAATGLLVLSLSKAQTAELPSECVWDLEDTVLGETYLAGAVTVTREVTR